MTLQTMPLRAFAAFGVIMLIAACSSPVHRVNKSAYGYGSRENLTMAELKPAIESAAARDGWSLRDVADGSFKAYREWGGGKHNILVEVTYRPKDFDISYVDSKLLGYTGTSIHHAYYDFVGKLETEIKNAVAKL